MPGVRSVPNENVGYPVMWGMQLQDDLYPQPPRNVVVRQRYWSSVVYARRSNSSYSRISNKCNNYTVDFVQCPIVRGRGIFDKVFVRPWIHRRQSRNQPLVARIYVALDGIRGFELLRIEAGRHLELERNAKWYTFNYIVESCNNISWLIDIVESGGLD